MSNKSDIVPLLADLEEIESLLRLSGVDAHIQKAKRLAFSVARRAPSGPISNQAMLLLSAIEDLQRSKPDAGGRIQIAISKLRAALGAH